MSPMNLLTKGRTIGGLKERPGRYKLLGNSVLPNFSGSKNPFPTTPHPEPEKAQPARIAQPRPAAASRKEGGMSAAAKISVFARAMADKRKKEEPGPAKLVSVAPAKDQPPKPGLWSQLAVIPAGWMHKWKPRRATPPFAAATVQTELVLEKVKVIRNDLSDDDLEVVTIEKKAGKKAEKPAQSEKVEREELAANP
jgi:hypothetical protein